MSRRRDTSQTPPNRVGSAEADARRHENGPATEDREIAVLIAVAEALTEWDSFERGSERLLRGLARALDLTAGAVWLPQADGLVVRAMWCPPSIDRSALEDALGHLQLPSGVGLPGRAWERREPLDREKASIDTPLWRSPTALGGLHATVALPALAGEQVLMVLELYSTAQVVFDKRLMQVLTAVGQLLGAFFSRRRDELHLSPLTAREREVLVLAAQGLARSRIADKLWISTATVKTHLAHIYAKLGAVDRTSAVAQALRAGLIE